MYDNLDFQRGVDVFLNSMQGASLVAMRRGFRETGAVDGTFGIFNTLMDSKSLFLTANSDTVFAMTWTDLSKGPVVLEGPPNSLGIVDDFWFRYVADVGNAGPDKGKGGKFLFLPPDIRETYPRATSSISAERLAMSFLRADSWSTAIPDPPSRASTKPCGAICYRRQPIRIPPSS